MELHSEQLNKPPVVRGARACTTCRAAKMKCIGAEDGQRPCQRCKRSNVECVFEKHRRGRKPGSKLSEASKMLRRLEKGLNSAKSKVISVDGPSYRDVRPPSAEQDPHYSNGGRVHPYSPRFTTSQLPPLNLPSSYPTASDYTASPNSRTMDINDEEDSPSDRAEDNIFPANFIQREHQRNSFFRTILNPEETPASGPSSVRGSDTYSPPSTPAAPAGLNDPVSAGLVDEEEAKVLFDLIFLRLNPFINLFDPSLHSVSYVRTKSPFLFTVLLMAGCKFFKPKLFQQCQTLANEYAFQAFKEGWKSVETVQAFACLTYWKDPDDNRTWTFIGYACRMAVELGLNRHIPNPLHNETEFQLLERRNRERTYLVLYIHDRSLSTQTGRNWMLPEDDFIRHADRWHERPNTSARPEDVIVASFVQLRHIAAETTEIFSSSHGSYSTTDMLNFEVVLRNCNSQLTQWNETWNREMQKAGGEKFHFSFMSFFRLYVRLFTNSLGIQEASNRAAPSVQALSICYTSAVDSLKIVSKDFASMSVLRYGQETTTMMSAYAAVFLLKLLRNHNTLRHLHDGATDEAHTVILQTAEAYHDASAHFLPTSATAFHARFLKGLAKDVFRYRKTDRSSGVVSPDTRSQDLQSTTASSLSSPTYSHSPTQSQEHLAMHTSPPAQQQFAPTPYTQPVPMNFGRPREDDYSNIPSHSLAPPSISVPHTVGGPSQNQSPEHMPPAPMDYPENDQQYWRKIFTDLNGMNMNGPMNVAEGMYLNHNAPYPIPVSNFGW
ncbi:fungal-specific transcription factor domain-containing protein [Rhodocollybia butyracea]|uniref:Fungal-specific transcription factor domain-containing protein n=1 Tax=Rhodocollybia butyracea TaxID=206335 RepID=A0A9P5PWB2_9AGAR|nr:fungal-specific transcription factor domain-containing protein [Rhodocollybia butyracea]